MGGRAYVFLILILSCIYITNCQSNVSVSGISGGGAMAIQFHVSHSSFVNGAGIIAGIPYWCANSDIVDALTACMAYPDLILVSELVAATKYAYSLASVDSPALLAKAKIWLYSGVLDSVVNPGVMKKVQSYYQSFVPSSNIKAVFNVTSEHAFITNSYGNKCQYLGSPFINNCGYDSVGDMFTQIYGNVNPRVTANPNNVLPLGQSPFVPVVGLDFASLADNAYLYVPTKCVKGSGCRIHVSFHGCEQTIALINDTYYMHTGYNEYAESNNIVVLYPQVKKTSVNPKGCWDWWGYTGASYATKIAVQIATVKNMIDFITKSYT